MKRTVLTLLLATTFLLSFANYVENHPTTFQQPDGSIVNCFITGDEFFRRLHDENGYTLMEDPSTGFLVYAVLENDNLVSSGYRYNSINPQQIDIQPNITISKEKYFAIRNEYHSHEIKPKSENQQKAGQNNGTLNNIVIFIRFSNQSEYTTSTSTIENMFNATTPNTASMYNFFKDMSYNQTFVQSYFYPITSGNTVISYQDSHHRNYYRPYSVSNTQGYQENERAAREHQLLADAIAYVSAQIPTSLNLDYNNDGYVDNICFIILGSDSGYSGLLWPHKWSLFSQIVYINNKRVGTYNFQLTSQLDVSTLCHEMYHSFGAPDLYHNSYDGLTPMGTWDVMAQNLTPPQSSTNYVKYKYGGWIQNIPEITQSGHYTLNNVMSSTNNCYKIAAPKLGTNPYNEFFIVEYRNKAEFWESALYDSGLLIYKINPSYNGNHYGPPDGIYVYRPDASNANTNGQIQNAAFSSNSGRTEFNNTTNPPCFLENGMLEDFRIYNISSAGTTMSFDIEFNTHYFNVSSDLAIFNNVNIDYPSEYQIITVQGLYIDSPISVVKGGTDADYFTVNQVNWNNYLGGQLQITFDPDQVRDYNAFINVYTPEFGTHTIQLTGNGIMVPVVADFANNAHNIWAGGQIQFQDLSTGNPISWEWTFYGGTPVTSTGQNPTVTYNIPGLYDVKLVVHNLHSSDTMIKTQLINIDANVNILICNNGFEYWTNGYPDCWRGTKTNAGSSKLIEEPYAGNYSARISNTFTSPKRFTSEGFQIDAGYEYYIKFYYKGKGNLAVSLYDERTDNSGFSPENDVLAIDTTVWSEYSKTVLATHSSSNGQLCFVLSKTNSSANHIMIDEVTITRSAEPISINSKITEEIKLYPNPNKGEFYLTNIQNANILITDIAGKIIYSKNNLKNYSRIDLSSFSNSIYFIKIEDNNKIFYSKIIIEK